MPRSVRIGVIASSNGSVLYETAKILKKIGHEEFFSFYVITDRPCGVEEACASLGIPHQRINEKSKDLFSEKAALCFNSWGETDGIILFFLRLVGSQIFSCFPTFNIHPSLLPAFVGFKPLEQALETKVRFFGATLHGATDKADAGPIVAQTCLPIVPECMSIERLQKISFLQKTYLMLVLLEALRLNLLELSPSDGTFRWRGFDSFGIADRANPALPKGTLLKAFEELQEREGLVVI